MNSKLLKALVVATMFPIATQALAADMTTQQAVKALKLQELALTFDQAKVAKATHHKSKSQDDALLIDMNVINVNDLNHPAVLNKKLSNFVTDQLNTTENYLGNVDDENIIERLNYAWQNAHVIQHKQTLNLLNSFIDKGYTTGYNVINKSDLSHFSPKLMLRYGHDNIQHATQLIYLMRTEGFDPKVQLTPKSSAYLYLAKWGKSSDPLTTLPSGKMVATSKEYNLDFEFKTPQRKAEFMDLINRYAKKDSKDEKGLIFQAWWQPFYRSYTPMKRYKVLMENRIEMGQYEAQLMVLPEKAKAQAEHIKDVEKNIHINTIKTWVNPSFYRYMHGDYK
ncbi:hypothetical protein [Celerinatantimonas yamalensis]|uniref:Uncharacterized protein n=1 Tax=Celerinatantimonas yamalensis TaxID=559956 RepID=A0ABW9G3Q7_9GAMM